MLLLLAFLPALFLSADAWTCDCPFFGVKWTTEPLIQSGQGTDIRYYWEVTVQESGEITSNVVYKINTPQGNFNCNFNFDGASFSDPTYQDCEFNGNGLESGSCVTGGGDCGSFATCGLFGSYAYVFSFSGGDFFFSDDCKCLQVGPVATPFSLYTRDGKNPDQCDFGDLESAPILWFASVYYTVLSESFTEEDLDSFLDYIADAIDYARDLIKGAIIPHVDRRDGSRRQSEQNFTIATYYFAKSTATANAAAQSAFDLPVEDYPYTVEDKNLVKNGTVSYAPSPASTLSLPGFLVSVIAVALPLVWLGM